MLIRQSEAGANAIVELVIEGEHPTTANAILREIQIDPVSQTPLHADLYRVVMDESINVVVPLEFVNVPEERLKMAQVMLTPVLREVEVECLPQDIPEVITVDLATLEVGDIVRAGALVLPQGVTLVTDPEEPVVATEALRGEEVEEAPVAGVAADEVGGGEERTAGEETPAG
jgi:large subunit ribosomal protein L25